MRNFYFLCRKNNIASIALLINPNHKPLNFKDMKRLPLLLLAALAATALGVQAATKYEINVGGVEVTSSNASNVTGGDIKITGFIRYEKGEGLQKREDNFAEEIANMVK